MCRLGNDFLCKVIVIIYVFSIIIKLFVISYSCIIILFVRSVMVHFFCFHPLLIVPSLSLGTYFMLSPKKDGREWSNNWKNLNKSDIR